MPSVFLFLGAFSAFLGVACGAFGAHGLKAVISPELLAVYQTGVNYQMWHALGLVAIGLLRQQCPGSKLLIWSGWLMFVGILIFSGSLYLLAVLDEKALGMVTPFGGICFLVAWLLLALSALKKPQPGTSATSKKHSRYH
ncbi:MAG: hypothetical protein CTY16_08625 [Methylobacter sp.]|nr:MAG: hypothetical protein CTY16_08625 [Methylobacter sp.]